MKEYHVTFYYLATGMEGIPSTKDYGIVEAHSAQEAIDIVCVKESIDRFGLGAREIKK